MKKYLLPRNGKFYKANMHTHTTVSDGKFTPEEAKERFKSMGYSIVAFTDHEVMVPQNQLRDESFLPITSYELAVSNGAWNPSAKCYHLNYYSADPDRTVTKTFCAARVWGNAKQYVTEEMIAGGSESRTYSKEFVQWVVDTAKEEDALISFNHPVWSLQDKDDYSGIKGLWGIEWHNTGCTRAGYADSILPMVDILREGHSKQVYPLATDDCHGAADYFGGWIQIKAPSLDYDTIFNALKKGDFYSSNGPEIKALYLEGDEVVIKTSRAVRVSLATDRRITSSKCMSDKPLTECRFSIRKLIDNYLEFPERGDAWFRIEVIDKAGNTAHTKAYFLNEIGFKPKKRKA